MAKAPIKLTRVSKRFKLYQDPVTGPVKEYLFFWKRHHYYQEIMAVKDASLEVRKGEIVGIIGPNGAGKTTLLKMIAGLLPVDQGRIEVNGKITALLALGVGVHPEFTGRENILYGGMLLGMPKAEVLRKLPGIIEFAELGDYIDRPLRTYSSGMRARLLFATSMSIDPDILVIDEALATGDAYFVQKSSTRIHELCRSGATILFVSHNLSQIQEICQRVLFMAEGRIVEEGRPAEMVAAYSHWAFEKQTKAPIISQSQTLPVLSGSGEVQIDAIRLINAQGAETTGFYSGENMEIEIRYHSTLGDRAELDLFLGFVLASNSSYIGEINTVNYIESLGATTKRSPLLIGSEGAIRLKFEPLLLFNEHYALWIILFDYATGRQYCEYRNVAPFFVGGRRQSISRGGFFWHPCKIVTG